MSDGSDILRHKTFYSGWLEHKDKKGNYQNMWVLLEGNVLFIFRNDQPSLDTQIGNLTLNKASEFHNKKGFKFDLHTADKVNTFRTKKSTEREFWRGYITGIAKHVVPSDLDLPKQNVQQIREEVAEYHGETRSRGYRQSIRSGHDSGVVSLMDSDSRADVRSMSQAGSRSSSGSHTSPSTVSDTLSGGGPTQVHMFYNDRSRTQPPPSWFVPHCSRETAEKLLQRANGLEYGNTLMRESTTFLQNGSYVISRIFVNSNGSISYDHYEVIRTAGGYKINVQNKHAPMKCLQDVMDYYITTSESGTKPIVTNDLATLGHDVPGYATEIYNRRSKAQNAESWTWPPPPPPGGAGDPSMEPEPDYDDAESVNRPLSSKHMDGSNTMSPGILRQKSRTPDSAAERKSVGWNSVVNTPPPLPQHHTYAPGSKQNRPVAPSVDEFKQRQKETDQLNDFDQMIGSFERSSMYVNTPARDEPDSVAMLPVAPPPPRDPIVQTKTSTPARPSPTSSVSSATRFVSPQKPQSFSSPLKHSASSVSTSGVKHISPNLGHSSSDGQIKQHVISPNSPQAFPVWNDATKKTNIVNRNVPNKPNGIETVTEHPHDDIEEGVDEHNPGGVSALRAKFSHIASSSPSSPSTHGVKKVGPMSHDDDTGFNEDFKKNLEATLFGQAPQGAAVGRGVPRTPTSPRNSQFHRVDTEEHLYQELPDIEPDGVTYVNERFNTNTIDYT